MQDRERKKRERERGARERGTGPGREKKKTNKTWSAMRSCLNHGSPGDGISGPLRVSWEKEGLGLNISRRRTNVQQLTCKIGLSNFFFYLFFSFVLIELKPFVFKRGKGEKFWKCAKKCEKNYETILPFSCCPLVFPRISSENENSKPGNEHLKREWFLRAWGNPKNLLRLFFASTIIFIFWGYS